MTAKTDVKLYALERDVFIPAVTGHHDVQEVAETAMATRLAMLRPSGWLWSSATILPRPDTVAVTWQMSARPA